VDVLDAYILTMHDLLGHARAAAYLDVPAYDERLCALCHPDRVGASSPTGAMEAVAARRITQEG